MSRCKFRSENGQRCVKPHYHNGDKHRDKQNNMWYDDGVVLDEEGVEPQKPLNAM